MRLHAGRGAAADRSGMGGRGALSPDSRQSTQDRGAAGWQRAANFVRRECPASASGAPATTHTHAAPALRRCLGVDLLRLLALPWLQAARRARSANTTASSWRTSSCCAAVRARRPPRTSAQPTATSLPHSALAIRGIRLAKGSLHEPERRRSLVNPRSGDAAGDLLREILAGLLANGSILSEILLRRARLAPLRPDLRAARSTTSRVPRLRYWSAAARILAHSRDHACD